MDRVHQALVVHVFLLKDQGVALILKGPRVQDLVSAAGFGGEGDQDIGLPEREDLADGIRAGAAHHDIREGEVVLQLLGHVLKLEIVLRADEALVQVAFSAEVEYGELLKKRGEIAAHRLVHSAGTETSADDEKNRLILRESGQLPGLILVAGKKLGPDGGAGQDSLILREEVKGLGEIAADLRGGAVGELVRQSGRHVGLVDHHRDVLHPGSADHGDRDVAAFGKNDVGLEFLNDGSGFSEALQHPERIGEILEIKITAQLPGRNTAVGDPFFHDQFLFDPFIGTDVQDIETGFLKPGDQCHVRGHMSCCSAAGENDFFHGRSSRKLV